MTLLRAVCGMHVIDVASKLPSGTTSSYDLTLILTFLFISYFSVLLNDSV